MTTLTFWEPDPAVLYPLEQAAQFAGLPHRHIVLYARCGLVQPAAEPSEASWYFTAEAIRTLRRIEMLRTLHRLDLRSIGLVLGLMDEIERLRGEISARGW